MGGILHTIRRAPGPPRSQLRGSRQQSIFSVLVARGHLGLRRGHLQLEASEACRRPSGPGSREALTGAPELHRSGLSSPTIQLQSSFP